MSDLSEGVGFTTNGGGGGVGVGGETWNCCVPVSGHFGSFCVLMYRSPFSGEGFKSVHDL